MELTKLTVRRTSIILNRESFNSSTWCLPTQAICLILQMCVCVCVRECVWVKTEWTQSNLSLIVCEMSFSRHRDGWRELRYQNLLNILQVHTPLPHSKKSPMVWKCVCLSEKERLKFDSYHSGYLRTSHLGSSTVSHGRFMPTAQIQTHTEPELESEKYKTEKRCSSSLLKRQTKTLDMNVQFRLDKHHKAFYGCVSMMISLQWPHRCHREFCVLCDLHHQTERASFFWSASLRTPW